MSKWILLDNTAVRKSDVRRIEYYPPSSTGCFIITLHDGKNMYTSVGQKGFDWCLKIMEDCKKNSAVASKEFDEDSDASEFSE